MLAQRLEPLGADRRDMPRFAALIAARKFDPHQRRRKGLENAARHRCQRRVVGAAEPDVHRKLDRHRGAAIGAQYIIQGAIEFARVE